MRVIGGKYKRLHIKTIDGQSTRPTTDKVKENIFNGLQDLEGIGLDLFAGSGGLGIEGLSRGLDKVIFVDGNFKATKMIKENLNTLYIPETQYEVYKNDAIRALKALNKRDIKFDYIFLDPPYRKSLIDQSLEKIQTFDLLNVNGTIICEFDKSEDIDTGAFKVLKKYEYGLTHVMLLTKGEDND
ncbi:MULTISPECIES: 16S rRNA (guanine(966)-N(2))-methyltransferase RsmD [Mammaliicoccus]|uniref:16S rRNA (Guanine(966)-N(2))-methyltransferase RsmD n=1 Tax=Mammaliicoccus sciuri TaxID=1296 RepID=A0AAW5LL01_MAMSC|nr:MULTISPECIES: 16S rRNA (guanine(966)-N(2))-methyltransferase RsmD [Mammaliicoccus]MCD5140385.1 16S rRNA (guanine(966)-N(2))-methyltransferase RsmD [Mammaliicoccus sciuri]MCD8881615.1 16S rRNA (guanine(966)-N(2))-methyltransferase RsmD [Mammaliicoccus sciuri]MCQ9302852.1 16S rRNA (guanine(966)-N(2))-methyltransferase RsmD [Mammaliicoccus sciuri]MDT0745377.1 16S rRNA (guanine(966)-N(2))-methyltransferase RsmD [Mammaliicoccus sciuri]MDT0751574.1 16S rRNA (guanine(966)-N(2))-methyltransferase R